MSIQSQNFTQLLFRIFLIWLQRRGLQLESITYDHLLNTLNILHPRLYHLEFIQLVDDVNAYSALEYHNFEQLKSLSLLGSIADLQKIVSAIFRSPLPCLEHLRLCCSFMVGMPLGIIFNSAHAIKKLFLQPLEGSYVNLNSFSSHFHHLQYLHINNIANTIQFDDSALMAIANQCSVLTTVILINCRSISHVSIQYLLKRTPIETLQINNKSFECYWRMLHMDEIIINQYLQSLSLHYCDAATTRFLEQMLLNGNSLHTLKLHSCSSIEDYSSIFQLTSLRTLKIHNCPSLNDNSFSIPISEHHSLRHLKLSHCSGLTDIGLLYIINRFPHLQSATLKECRNITSMSIRQIVSICSKLEKLHLRSMKVSDIHHLAPQNSDFLDIRQLKISYCAHIKYSHLSYLMKKLPFLRSLKITRTGDSYGRYDFLKVLAQECRYLQHFVLHDEESGLLPREVMFIVGNLSHLRSLSILMKEFVSEEKYREARLKYKSINPYLELDIQF